MLLLIFSLLLLPSISYGKYLDHMKIQYAGDIGFLSIGIGKDVTSRYSFDFFYGYVPTEIGGSEIQTYTLKNNYSLIKNSIATYKYDIYSGLSLYHVIGLRYQTSRFANFPRNYYRLSSIRAQVYLGGNLEYNKRNSFYFEAGVNDIWLINYINNKDTLNLNDYIALALGWMKPF